jgi:hypothetical protein
MRMAALAGALSAAGAGAGPLHADEVIFDNFISVGLNCYGCTGPNSQDAFSFPWDAGVADDFVLMPSPDATGKWRLTSLSWSGAIPVGGGPSVPIDQFHIIIWPQEADVPARPAGSTASGPPDYSQALFNLRYVPTISIENEIGPRFWDYEADILDNVLLDPDVPYWIEIQAVSGFHPYWTWQPVNGGQGARPHQGDMLLGIAFWQPTFASQDMSFVLYGEPAPEPATMALMLAAGGAWLSRRRRPSKV